LVLACCSFNGKIMLQYYTPQEGAAACIVQLAISLAMASDEQPGIAEQVRQALRACSTQFHLRHNPASTMALHNVCTTYWHARLHVCKPAQ
jgi:hypothetical protein